MGIALHIEAETLTELLEKTASALAITAAWATAELSEQTAAPAAQSDLFAGNGAAEPAAAPAAAPAEEKVEEKPKARRGGRKAKLEAKAEEQKPAISTGEERVGPDEVTLDTIRASFGEYLKKYGTTAAQADGPSLIKDIFADQHIDKISGIPVDNAEKLAKLNAAILQATETNRFKRPLAGDL